MTTGGDKGRIRADAVSHGVRCITAITEARAVGAAMEQMHAKDG